MDWRNHNKGRFREEEQGVRSPLWDDLPLSYFVARSGAPFRKKNPRSTPT